ncbi:MAG: helix-turn-helix domain-containing protein [Planctomycetes bacterium]|nr:helix-turn-helix domain-containing protein [Planctomycetota bacterium]
MSRGTPVSGLNPAVLRWARQSAGLTVLDVASKLHKDVEVVEGWERGGGDAPTWPQLEKLAYTYYRRPAAIFFLSWTPPSEIRGRADQRRLRDITSLFALQNRSAFPPTRLLREASQVVLL